jgi:hypothetical protein
MNIHAHYVIALSHTRDSSGMDAKCAAQNLYTGVKRATHDSPYQVYFTTSAAPSLRCFLLVIDLDMFGLSAFQLFRSFDQN